MTKRVKDPFNIACPLRRRKLFKLARKYGWKCWYCGLSLTPGTAQVDHIIPKAGGGRTYMDNLALSCMFCNRAKWDNPLEVFLEWLEHVRMSDTPYKPDS